MATVSADTIIILPDGTRHRAGDLARLFNMPISGTSVTVPDNTTIIGADGTPRAAGSEAFRSWWGTITPTATSRADQREAEGLPRPSTTITRGETPGAAPAPTPGDKNALAMLESILGDYGFNEAERRGLSQWAWGLITGGAGQAEVLLKLRERPEFKAKFPEIEARQKAGLAPVSPGEIIEYRRRARQMFAQFGLPRGFYDEDRDFADFLTKDISLSELQERVEQGYARAVQAPAEVRAELKRFFGVGEGELAAFYLDEDRALPLLMRQHRTAEIGGASQRTGFGALELTEADELAGRGISDREAEAGFGALAESRELFSPLIGQERSEEGISRSEQLSAAFAGDANARRKLERQARRRTSVFESGGGFAAGREGLSGLGSSD